jgi:general secretion pathway protein G
MSNDGTQRGSMVRRKLPFQGSPGTAWMWCRARRLSQGGFTLLELMVVLVVLALLASIAAPQVTKYLKRAKAQTAKVQVDALSAAVDAFHLDVGRFPTTEEGLRALVDRPANARAWDGPYLKKRESLLDPWGHPYRYRIPGQHGEYDIYTLGSDNVTQGEVRRQDNANGSDERVHAP